MEKYTTSKDDARLKKDLVPPEEFRVKRDEQELIRKSVVIQDKRHGSESKKDKNWQLGK